MEFKPTIPNFLTIFRVVLILPILYLIWNANTLNLFIAVALYGLSAITDMFDGMIARKFNQTSEFGAYFDPLADKILIWSLFTLFAFMPGLMVPIWLVMFLYIRDFLITFLRTYSKKHSIQFKTSFIAKAKTTVQMVAVLLIMVYLFFAEYLKGPDSYSYVSVWNKIMPGSGGLIAMIPLGLTILTVLFTIYTGLDYFLTYQQEKNRKGTTK